MSRSPGPHASPVFSPHRNVAKRPRRAPGAGSYSRILGAGFQGGSCPGGGVCVSPTSRPQDACSLAEFKTQEPARRRSIASPDLPDSALGGTFGHIGPTRSWHALRTVPPKTRGESSGRRGAEEDAQLPLEVPDRQQPGMDREEPLSLRGLLMGIALLPARSTGVLPRFFPGSDLCRPGRDSPGRNDTRETPHPLLRQSLESQNRPGPAGL